MATLAKLELEGLDDLALAGKVATRDPAAVRPVTERNNQRPYRAAWSIVRNRAEAADAVQSGYLRAFAAHRQLAGRASVDPWLMRVLNNETLGRSSAARRRRTHPDGGGGGGED